MPFWTRLIGSLGCVLLAFGAIAAEPAWRLEKFPLPPAKSASFQDLVIDETGSPWALANGQVHYFDGEKFVALDSMQFKANSYGTSFLGGPDEGAFLTQVGANDHEGVIYRLRGGQCQRLTTFYSDTSRQKPCLYVSKNRRLFNWGQAFLAVYEGDDWKRIEANFGDRADMFRPAICDLGTDVYFYSIYDNRIYCCNGANQLSVTDGPAAIAEQIDKRKREREYPPPITNAIWGDDRVLLAFANPAKLMAFDIRTKALVDVEGPTADDKRMIITDAFRLRSGAVWLLSPTFNALHRTVHELAPDGTLRELTALRGTDWSNSIHLQFPQSMLETSDGAVAIGVQEHGVTIYRDGQAIPLGWRQGLFAYVNSVRLGKDGKLWAPCDRSGQGVMRITLGAGPPPVEERFADWSEFKLLPDGEIWKLPDGDVALFEADRPGELTRCSGDKTTYQKMPFETSRVFRSIVDDRGHLLVTVYPERTFEIRKDGVEEFESMQAALAAAVKGGAKRFHGSRGVGGAILAKDGRLWYLVHNSNFVHMLRDDAWSDFSFRDDVYSLLETPDGDVVIRTQGGKLFRYDTGQMKELPYSSRTRRDQMLGPRTMQLFDKEIFAKSPGTYLPLLRQFDGTYRVYFDLAEYEQAQLAPAKLPVNGNPPATGNSAALDSYFERFVPSRLGGGWILMSQGAGPPYRVFPDKIEKLDLTETPLSGLWISDIKEAADGDVWFVTRYNDFPRAFRLRLSQLTLAAEPIEKSCGRQLAIAVDVQPEQMASSVELFAKINDQPTPIKRTSQGKILLRFPSSGVYTCTIGASRLGATSPHRLEFVVDATVLNPETKWNGPSTDVSVTTLEWRPPVAAISSEAGAAVQLAWRIRGESWQTWEGTPRISLIDREPGEYEIEFKAIEDDYWSDPTPVVVKVRYSPDLESIVGELVQRVGSADNDVRQKSAERLQSLGARALPYLDQEIKAAESAIQTLPKLRSLKSQIEFQERQKRQR